MIHAVTMSITPGFLERCLRLLGPQVNSGAVLGNSADPRVNASIRAVADHWGVRYYEKPHGITYAEGNNLLAAAAPPGADLLLVNDDAAVLPFTVGQMNAHGADVTGVLIRDGRGAVNHAGVHWVPRRGSLMPRHLGKGDELVKWQNHSCDPQSTVTFATVLVRRETWEELGGLDEGYVWGFEDVDFGLRASYAGKRVIVCREGLVIHSEFSSRGKGNLNMPYAKTLASVQNAARLRERWTASGKLAEILGRLG